MTDTREYTSRVTRCDDGVYRWSYEVDMSTKGAVYASAMKVLGIIAIIVAASGFFMPEEAWPIALLPAVGLIVLPALGWLVFYRGRAARQPMRFEMNEERIHIPGLYKAEDTSFSVIRGVAVRPDQDLIELRTATMTLIQVFVPGEDFDFVKEFIISRVSPMANVREEV